MGRVIVAGLVWVVGGCTDEPSGDGGSTGGASSTSSSPTTTIGNLDDTGDPSGPADSGTTAATTADTTVAATGDPDSSDGSSTGGSDGPDVDLSDPQLYEFELDPVELDPTCVDNLQLQYAHLDTRVQPLGKLVFFLSGYTNTPASWREHGIQLAGFGFHVVEPHYANDWDCGGMGGTCNEDTRWEALTGEDASPVLDTSRADSAEGRVVTMLLHLAEVHPGGDWTYYLDADNNLRYEDVIIAGISHGASSSGLFATRRSFARVVMHSGAWWNVGGDPATPIDVFYGLAHTDDPQYDGIIGAWEGAGMLGVPTSIDGATPPYGGANQLITSVPNGYPHCSTCVAGDSPTDADGYVFDPAWRAIYGAPQLD